MTLEQYLIDVGIRACDHGRELEESERRDYKNNVEYFKKCHEQGLSAYKAVLFFYDYLKGDYEI